MDPFDTNQEEDACTCPHCTCSPSPAPAFRKPQTIAEIAGVRYGLAIGSADLSGRNVEQREVAEKNIEAAYRLMTHPPPMRRILQSPKQTQPVGVKPVPFPAVMVSNKLAELEAEIVEHELAAPVLLVSEEVEAEFLENSSLIDFAAPPRSTTTYDQPAPRQNNHPALWPQVIEDIEEGYVLADSPDALRRRLQRDMAERDFVGQARYGTALQPWNGRDALADGYSEALDLVVYLKQAGVEDEDDAELFDFYVDALDLSANILRHLAFRNGLKG